MHDSRGKDVFEFYKGGSLQATLVPTQVSMQLNYNLVLGSPYYFYVEGDTARKTVGASTSLSFVGKVTGGGANKGKPYDVINGLVRPSYRAEIGLQRNLNTFYNIKLIPRGNNFTHAGGMSVYLEYQNVNFYDTLSQIIDNKRPIIYGLHGHINLFHTKSGLFAISLSGDIYKSYNQDALTPFQERTQSTYIDPNVVSVGDVFGNIGAFDRVTAYRLRASLPIFVNEWISLTPYTSMYGYIDDEPKNLTGMALNLFNGSPAELKGSIVQGFGIGVDWLRDNNEWSSANVSLYGSLNLDLLRKSLVGRLYD